MIARLALALCLVLSPVARAEPTATVSLGEPLEAEAPMAFGGGVWRVPKVARVAEPALLALGEGGTWRAALAWEVLAAARSPEDVTRLLQDYPLNGFLADRAAAGGRIIITLDAMPRFLARERSDEKLADGPLWARSATDDLAGWADVVFRVAEHFRSLGIDATYEVWNEPDHSFRGGIEDYMALYRATVLGARRADPQARIAGPALSDWTAAIDGERWVAAFLRRAAETPLPDLGLDRLPVDALTYHSFNRVPGRHHARVADEARALLARYGYDAELICSEWNVAAEPPYPEGDLNGTWPGAVHAGATLIAMAEAGVQAQVFQMAVDPGTQGYSAGVLTAAGTPRPVWQAFDMAQEAARGTAFAAASDDGVVSALAFRDGDRLAVLLAVFPPTDLMLARDSMEPVALTDPVLFATITRAGTPALADYFLRGGAMPEMPPDAAAALKAGRAAFVADQAAREVWRSGGTVRLLLPGPARLVAHRVLDETTAIPADKVARADDRTNALLRDLLGQVETDLRALMADGKGADARRYGDALADRLDGRDVLTGADPALVDVDRSWIEPAQARLLDLAEEQRRQTVLAVADSAPSAEVTLAVRPYSLHLLVFEVAP